jgi:BirA family biotin operon repressor/biotin-[acetyl-CoA-carboxylase] ligase
LAALSIAESCSGLGLAPRIKWPNDILLSGKKAAGILVETVWSGHDVDSLVIGMGVNVYKASVPPIEVLQFPATSLEDALEKEAPAREDILLSILKAFIRWQENIGSKEIIQAWEKLLAFRGEHVEARAELGRNTRTGDALPLTGRLIGLEPDGSLRLQDSQGKPVIIRFGDVSLRSSDV